MSSFNDTYDQAHQADAELLLEEFDTFICIQARKQVHLTHATHYADVLIMDGEDLAQETRIHFWQALLKQQIDNHKAYIRRIIHNEDVSRLRQKKPTLPLPLDEDGELNQSMLPAISFDILQDSEDPQQQLEQAETFSFYRDRTADVVTTLPGSQQHATLCSLKDRVDDLLAWTEAFRARGLDLSAVQWPSDQKELQAQRSSASIARRKLRKAILATDTST